MCTLCKFDKTVDTSSSRALLYQWIIGIHRQDMEDVWHTKTDTIALRIRSPSRECCRRCFKSILLYQGLPMRTQNTETILTININQSLFLKSTVFVFRTVFIFLAYSCDTNFSSTFCSFQIFSDLFQFEPLGRPPPHHHSSPLDGCIATKKLSHTLPAMSRNCSSHSRLHYHPAWWTGTLHSTSPM